MIYQVTIAQKIDTVANYKAWGQSFGAALSSFGWSAQSGHGELVTSGSGGSYAWTNVAALPTVALQPMSAYNFKGAWVSGTTYVGSNTVNGTADVVTNGGLTYVHITASSSSATAPGSDATNWQPFNYEIWKSNGSNSAGLPIYVRFVYTTGTNAVPAPIFHLSIGTSIDASGNVSNAVSLFGSTPLTNIMVGPGTSSAGSANLGDMDFSGDADNFRMITYRAGTGVVTGLTNILVIDRAKTAAGQDSDAYVYIGNLLGASTNSGSLLSRSSIILKPTLGPIIAQTSSGWCGATGNGLNAPTSLINFGAIAPFPIFPIVGFCANPLLGCVGVSRPDVIDGTILSVWIYGASHNYMISSSSTLGGATLNNAGSNGVIPAILWE